MTEPGPKWIAPFTTKQVEMINDWQWGEHTKPLTCPNRHGGEVYFMDPADPSATPTHIFRSPVILLVARQAGLVCPVVSCGFLITSFILPTHAKLDLG